MSDNKVGKDWRWNDLSEEQKHELMCRFVKYESKRFHGFSINMRGLMQAAVKELEDSDV